MADSKLVAWVSRWRPNIEDRWPCTYAIRADPQGLVDAMVADGLTFTVPEPPHVHDWVIVHLGGDLTVGSAYPAMILCRGCGDLRCIDIKFSDLPRWEGEVSE